MKTKITYIGLSLLIMSVTGLFAQGTEGQRSNSDDYLTQRNLDLQNRNQNTQLNENENQRLASPNAPAVNLINYQAVARDAAGDLMVSVSVTIDFIIHEATASGTIVFSETQNLSTDANGVFSAQIGSVSSLSVSWSSNAYFLEVKLDGTSVGTTEFVSVPYAKSADTMPYGARIGESNVSSADVVTISGSNTQVGEIIDIRATNIVTADNDLMNMDMPTGSSIDAQFIEARNAGTARFQVHGDGRTFIKATTTAPALNTVYGNSMPIAYGSVAVGFNNIQTGYGIISIANPTVGQYDIEIDHATDVNNCVVLITPFTGSFGTPEICGYEPTGTHTFTVRIQTVAGVPRDSAFTFVVYGNH